MTDEYIRKQDAIEEIRKAENHAFNSFYKGLVKAHKIVADLLPADVAHVIHCRNCKYFRAHRCMDSMPIEICDLDQTFYDPDRDFCSLAESREG